MENDFIKTIPVLAISNPLVVEADHLFDLLLIFHFCVQHGAVLFLSGLFLLGRAANNLGIDRRCIILLRC